MCVFLLVVFAAPQQETTLASPRLATLAFARLRSAAPGRGAQIAKNTITEQTLHRLAARVMPPAAPLCSARQESRHGEPSVIEAVRQKENVCAQPQV